MKLEVETRMEKPDDDRNSTDLRAELAEKVHVRKVALRGQLFDLESIYTDAWIEASVAVRPALLQAGSGSPVSTIEGVELRFHEVPGGPVAQLVLRNHGLARVMPLLGADHGIMGQKGESDAK